LQSLLLVDGLKDLLDLVLRAVQELHLEDMVNNNSNKVDMDHLLLVVVVVMDNRNNRLVGMVGLEDTEQQRPEDTELINNNSLNNKMDGEQLNLLNKQLQ